MTRTHLLLPLLLVCAVPAGAQDAATIASHDLPVRLAPGAGAAVQVRVRNTGSSTWTRQAGFKLGAVDDRDPFYRAPRVWLPQGVVVRPGQAYTFRFTLTAPAQTGSYRTDWRMVHEGVRWFGATAARQVQVGASAPPPPPPPGGGADDARIVSVQIPTSLAPGSRALARVRVRNTGSSTWSRAGAFKLGAVDDRDPFHRGGRVDLPPGVSVRPGAEHTFELTLVAPRQPGRYTTDWRMVHEHVRWFGQTAARQVQVGAGGQPPPPPPGGGVDDSVIVQVQLPGSLTVGAPALGRIRVRNSGTSTWTRDAFRLGAVDDRDPFHRGGRILLPQGVTVPPGAEHTFEITLQAPNRTGQLITDWRMVHEHVRWFGQTDQRPITVTGGGTLPVVDASTLTHKLIMGYQGWFAAPNDGVINRWRHWFRGNTASVQSLTVDMWPDMSELGPDEKLPTGFTLPDGSPAPVFSSAKRATVVRHFKWMKDNGLDGIALQRFTLDLLRNPRERDFRDLVARHVKDGAEMHGRVFFLMYDISGHDPATVIDDVKNDWRHLVNVLQLTRSNRYLRHRGRPLLCLWGFGFDDRPGTPGQVQGLIDWFKTNSAPQYRVTLMGGVPTHWRTLNGDSKPDPGWARVYRSFDVISPWTVGRYRDDQSADSFMNTFIRPDRLEAQRAGADYMPVVWPGFSWKNLKPNEPFNAIPRRGGRFYWRQIYNALDAGCTMIYGAMFDEVDEGTAMFKIAPTRDRTPAQARLVPLDVDGERLPSDWYLRLAGEAGKALRGEIPRSARRPIDP